MLITEDAYHREVTVFRATLRTKNPLIKRNETERAGGLCFVSRNKTKTASPGLFVLGNETGVLLVATLSMVSRNETKRNKRNPTTRNALAPLSRGWPRGAGGPGGRL